MDDVSQSIAWRYHQATNHSVESLRANRHTLDWANQPRPYKRYAGSQVSVALPQGGQPSQALDASLLGKLLQLSAGITKWLTVPGGKMAFRAAACTGALYHIDLYVVCGNLEGVPAGVYHFDVENIALTRLRDGDFRGALVDAAAGDERVRHAPATIVASSTWWRNSWKYQARAYRHSFWDSGTLLANLLTVAEAYDLPATTLLGFADTSVNTLLDLDPAREAALELVAVGHADDPALAAPAFHRLYLPTQTYSFSEMDEPLIRHAHEATSLAMPEEVEAWRSTCGSGGSVSDASGHSHQDPSAVETVIRRRGSAREFERTAIPLSALETMLATLRQSPAGDWASPLSDAYLIVNAVDGLPSGSYFWTCERLEPLMLGDYRAIAGRLDLGQDLAADAAVNIYFLADLRAILSRCGERGYRAAQFDASLSAGKLYLAAYANGLAATGLTFFDDEVVDFFSPHAAGKSVMFLLAIGNRSLRRH